MSHQTGENKRSANHLALVGWSLLILAAYVVIQSAYDLWTRAAPESSAIGLALGAAALLVTPALVRTKLRVASAINSPDSGLLFVGKYGRPLNPSNIRNRDHLPRLTRLGLSRFRLHDFRHFHATTLIASGVDYRTVGDRLGHRSPSFTLATYSHAAVQAQERAAMIANGLLTESGVLNRWVTAAKHC